jgi:hypothetical protein
MLTARGGIPTRHMRAIGEKIAESAHDPGDRSGWQPR